MTHWYALRARHELKMRDALAERGVYGYVPMETVDCRSGRRVQPKERPVWRGYVFVICTIDDLAGILAMSGAHDFVRRWDLSLVTLPLHMLDPIIAAEWAGELDYSTKTYSPRFGDHVRVTSGKWKGWLGRIMTIGKSKITIEPDKFSGRLQIEADQLEAAA